MATVHRLGAYVSAQPKFPTPLERTIYDLPPFPEEDEEFIPDLFNSRATPSLNARDGAGCSAPNSVGQPHEFIDMTETFKDALAVVCIIITLFVTLAVLP